MTLRSALNQCPPRHHVASVTGQAYSHEIRVLTETQLQARYIQISRAEKRKKNRLIKWFHNNWHIVSPFMEYVVLLNASESE